MFFGRNLASLLQIKICLSIKTLVKLVQYYKLKKEIMCILKSGKEKDRPKLV